MTNRERVLRSLNRDAPGSLVVESYISAATWKKYREKLIPIAKKIPNDFISNLIPSDYDKMPDGFNQDEVYEDTWGCIWHCRVAGMQGIISQHPLQTGFDALKMPDPLKTSDLWPWDKEGFENNLSENVKNGKFIICGYERLWERVHFLRGYENVMMDLAECNPEIRKTINTIVDYNIESIQKFMPYPEVDCIAFQDDWGEQNRLMVSPDMWREYFYEGYRRMFQSAKAVGKYVYFHTDGYLLPVIDDLISAGADIINIQSGCHDIEDLHQACCGKVCVSVDIDRQKVMPFGTAEEVKQHIRDIYYGLNGNEGGVWVKMDVYPDVPLTNIEAMCKVFWELRGEGSID
jgi:uroporphyrinogen decarboxylase